MTLETKYINECNKYSRCLELECKKYYYDNSNAISISTDYEESIYKEKNSDSCHKSQK